MPGTKADIIAQLQKDILSLQGFKSAVNGTPVDMGLGPVKNAFPNRTFPLGAVHEFIAPGPEDRAAASGFIAGLLSSLMPGGGALLWVSPLKTVFPPALKSFGIQPDKVIFVHLQKEKDILWVMEEALKCGALSAVVAELSMLSFADSRRLQLAVEQSQVTGFILRLNPRNLNATTCVSRWRITSVPSRSEDDLPGIGFPHWNVELLKIRNGKPGSWEIRWVNGKFQHAYGFATIIHHSRKKTG